MVLLTKVLILKQKTCNIIKSIGSMFRRKVRSIEMKRYTLLDHTDQAKCLICQRSDLFKRFYIVQGSFKTNQEVYVETESKQLAIKIWSMTRRCCPVTRRCCLFLRKFQLGSYWTYHTPSNWPKRYYANVT